MSKQTKLVAQTRQGIGRGPNNRLRAAGRVPAVMYGSKETPTNLDVSARELSTLLGRAVGENILVDLEIVDGERRTNKMALIQEVQHDPVNGRVTHVDFHAVSMDEKIHAEVVVEPVGVPNGVKNFGGVMEQLLRAVEIECLPKDLPEVIQVDVSGLNIGDSIHIRDLPLGEGVRATADSELAVFLVAAPRVEEEPAAAAEQPAAPEVIKEKKEEPAAEEKGK